MQCKILKACCSDAGPSEAVVLGILRHQRPHFERYFGLLNEYLQAPPRESPLLSGLTIGAND